MVTKFQALRFLLVNLYFIRAIIQSNIPLSKLVKTLAPHPA